ncbi:hypothetical protein LEP1GSC178_0805 [Leptospira licerasiae str. MMD4847]|uniref:Uncharacterized protein n=1 Tax=Leptospira licerasiae str. MMD4847 TaxID=1049971 RepID=A0ABN0H6R0_9LEPT|nr:hypothetical protein LEP1GSC178_0805 [Leptospira licerasiae str. MMD4847]
MKWLHRVDENDYTRIPYRKEMFYSFLRYDLKIPGLQNRQTVQVSVYLVFLLIEEIRQQHITGSEIDPALEVVFVEDAYLGKK